MSPIVIAPYISVVVFWRHWLAVPAFLMSIHPGSLMRRSSDRH